MSLIESHKDPIVNHFFQSKTRFNYPPTKSWDENDVEERQKISLTVAGIDPNFFFIFQLQFALLQKKLDLHLHQPQARL